MINELYQLTVALEQAGVTTEHTHPKYKPIPRVTKKAPCVHILLDKGRIYKIGSIEAERAVQIRKYGSNQGTFPALNLAPLYRLSDEKEKKMVDDLIEGKTTDFNMEEIRRLCRKNNWGEKFRNKYRISMRDVPREMTELLEKTETEFYPLQQLIEETRIFENAAYLHEELERAAFERLEQKKGIPLALQILFYFGKLEKGAEEDYGTLSVVLDCKKLRDEGLTVATAGFTGALNQKLIEADAALKAGTEKAEMDAFGQAFAPLEEPMPTVKLAAGFEVSLRTMFRGQPCQSRYGRIENATYPISKEMRFKLQSALAWLGDEEHKGVTWISTGKKDEALFAYPEFLRENRCSMLGFCKRQDGTVRFEKAAEAFISEIKKAKEPGTDPMSERIQYFVLRKLDKARTKVVYTYNTSPKEIECCSEQWSLGCQNLPAFSFGRPVTLFPLEVSDILNRIWASDGTASADKSKPFPRYYGMKLLFGEELSVIRRDLFILMNNTTNLATYFGEEGLSRGRHGDMPDILRYQTCNTLALMGLLLYQLGIRKEKYMQEFPYLFGQLLKVSDALHEMYCRVVRNNDIPNTFAGSGLFTAGMEQPYKTLVVLARRMDPYIAWARTYRAKGIQNKGEESWRAGWYLSLYETFTTQLHEAWNSLTRLNDEEKALYFIGYMAAFPKKEKAKEQQGDEQPENSADNSENEAQE